MTFRLWSLSAAALASLLIVPSALAISWENNEDTARLEIGSDVYTAGSSITIKENIQGDLFVVGGTVIVRGNVRGDLTVLGGTVRIEGNVQGNTRAGASDLTIEGEIGGNLLVGAGTIELTDSSSIQGEALINASNARALGKLESATRINGENATLSGKAMKPLTVYADSIHLKGIETVDELELSGNISIGEGTSLRKGVNYWTPVGQMDFGSAKMGAQATFNNELAWRMPVKKDAASAATVAFSAFSLYNLLSAALLILLLLFLTKTYFPTAASKLSSRPAHSIVYGFLYFVAAPVLALLFFITIIGIPIGLLIVTSYIFSIVFSFPFAALTWACVLAARMHWKTNVGILFPLSLVFYIVLKLLAFVPFVGWLVVLVAVCGAFGALFSTKYEKFLAIR